MTLFESLGGLLDITEPIMISMALVFIRVSAMVSILPGFGEQTIPVRVKLGVALSFTILVWPLVTLPPETTELNGFDFLPLILSETIVGLALGLSVRLILIALQFAGSIASQSASLAKAINAVVLSYQTLPAGQLPTGSDIAQWGIAKATDVAGIAFTLSAPFIVASFAYNLMLGFINRAMPQLMVAFIGAPAITAGGIFMLILAAPALLMAWHTHLDKPEPFWLPCLIERMGSPVCY